MAYPVIGQCPVCHEALEVTELHCRTCDTTVRGHFSLGRFYQLSAEQLAFAETFVRCAGRIKKVEKELGISYPTVRNRLFEVIRALGYEVEDEVALTTEQRKEILEQLAAGELSAEDAVKLLRK
jgi:hypothetical protein